MHWKKPGKELDLFAEFWINCKEIIIYGAGNNCNRYIDELKQDFNIIAIIDNDINKIGSYFHGVKVFPVTSVKDKFLNAKVIISTHYAEASEQLISYGLLEDRDFFELNKFISMWYWFNYKKVHIPEVHLAVTTKCTLNCKHCNMYIPYYSKPQDQELENLKNSIDSYFKLVDKTYIFSLLGGEPFLYPRLDELIQYIGRLYRNRMAKLEIVTNGTLTPKDDLLHILQKFDVSVTISNYSKYVPYRNNLDELGKLLEQRSISYEKKDASYWLDFGFPHHSLNIPTEKLVNHMQECSPVFKGLNDAKFYYCHLSWSAVQSGLLPEDNADYLDLLSLQNNSNDKMKLIEYSLGYMPKGYVTLCKYCGGCARTNTKVVSPAIQQCRGKV